MRSFLPSPPLQNQRGGGVTSFCPLGGPFAQPFPPQLKRLSIFSSSTAKKTRLLRHLLNTFANRSPRRRQSFFFLLSSLSPSSLPTYSINNLAASRIPGLVRRFPSLFHPKKPFSLSPSGIDHLQVRPCPCPMLRRFHSPFRHRGSIGALPSLIPVRLHANYRWAKIR